MADYGYCTPSFGSAPGLNVTVAWQGTLSCVLKTLCILALSLSLGFFATQADGGEGNPNEIAIQYLKSLPSQTNIYVWPTRIRPFEIIGDDENKYVSDLVENYGDKFEDIFSVTVSFQYPQISVYVYGSSDPLFINYFMTKSKLPNSYKAYIGTLQMDFQSCVFTTLLGSDNWAAGGVVFVDRDRLGNKAEQLQCIEAGLDYINGFPTEVQLDFRDFPDPEVREIILRAVSICSADGQDNVVRQERTMDGLTPLPSVNCAIRAIGD